MHTDPYVNSGSDISTYGNLETLLNFVTLVAVEDTTTTSKGKSETNLWSSVHGLGKVRGLRQPLGEEGCHSPLGSKRPACPAAPYLLFSHCIPSRVKFTPQPFTVPHVHTESTQEAFRLSTEHCIIYILYIPGELRGSMNRCWG